MAISRSARLAAITVAATFGGLSAALAAGQNDEVGRGLREGRAHVPTELLVQFRADATPDAVTRVLAQVNASVAETVIARSSRSDGKGDLRLVRIPPGLALSQAISVLQSNPLVEFAEPNWIYTKQQFANPDDPMLADLWGMLSASTSPPNAYGSGALAAWNAGRRCTSEVHIGIIDEGLMTSHADLRQGVWANPSEVPANGRDDDGNGLADDINGWDFVNNDNTVYDGRQDDHGTHVAGTAAASTNNATGVFGVCGHAKMISAKFLGRNGGTTSNAIKAVDYLTDLKKRKAIRLVATNNSWGGGGYSQALADAIDRAGTAGILFIAAAGNDGKDLDSSPSYPASYALGNMIVVAATDRNGSKASFSNYGQNTVQIGAPGVDILSTVPSKTGAAGYARYNGTSMATPHVTGAAALYASLNPCATATDIRDAILGYASFNSQLSGGVENSRQLNVASFTESCSAP